MIAAPDGLRYSEDDLWVEVEGMRRRIGITDFAQDQLGEIVYLELPEAGASISADEPFGVVESAKAVIDLISPLSGIVLERNSAALERPALMNEEPYAGGWLLIVEPTAPLPAGLMSAESYRSLRAG